MFLPKYFQLKKEKEKQSGKVFFLIGTGCILLGICDYFAMKDPISICCMYSMLYFIGLSYCVLGNKKYYEVKRFKGHKILRWCIFLIVVLYCILVTVLYLTVRIDIEIQEAALLVLVLFMSITALRNGSGSGS